MTTSLLYEEEDFFKMEEIKAGNKYKYTEETERFKKMNRFYIAATSVLGCIFIFYLWLKLSCNAISHVTVYGNTALIAVFAIVNTIVYLKNKETRKLKDMATWEICIEYLLIGVQTSATFISYAIIMIFILQIPYYEKKSLNRTAIATLILYIIVMSVQASKGIYVNDVNAVCGTFIVILTGIVILQVGKLCILFNEDAIGSAREEHDKVKMVLDDMLEISQTVNKETDESRNIMDQLVSTTENVTSNMKEITAATNMTATSIEEQNTMTTSIQQAIEHTGEVSNAMVDIAIDSNDSIKKNIEIMTELKTQSAQIKDTNKSVTDSMSKLQQKTKEVENIADMILNISSQTNLLALNASIESARAGEAGRGFAVVAEQIRQLAEQTKGFTEDITKIIYELNANADDVVESVRISVNAADTQSDNINSASQTFEQLNSNMSALVEHVEEVNKQISGLSDSNNKIVENISQLSAVTQEVTVNAEQVHNMSEQNLKYAEQVKQAVEHIRGTSQKMHIG